MSLPRTHVDHRVELDPAGLAVLVRIEVDALQVLLRRPLVEQQRLFIRMQVTTDRHQPTLDIDDRLHELAEQALGQGTEVLD